MDIVSYAEAAAAHKTAKSKKQYIIAEEAARPDITKMSDGDSWFNKTSGKEMVVLDGTFVEASKSNNVLSDYASFVRSSTRVTLTGPDQAISIPPSVYVDVYLFTSGIPVLQTAVDKTVTGGKITAVAIRGSLAGDEILINYAVSSAESFTPTPYELKDEDISKGTPEKGLVSGAQLAGLGGGGGAVKTILFREDGAGGSTWQHLISSADLTDGDDFIFILGSSSSADLNVVCIPTEADVPELANISELKLVVYGGSGKSGFSENFNGVGTGAQVLGTEGVAGSGCVIARKVGLDTWYLSYEVTKPSGPEVLKDWTTTTALDTNLFEGVDLTGVDLNEVYLDFKHVRGYGGGGTNVDNYINLQFRTAGGGVVPTNNKSSEAIHVKSAAQGVSGSSDDVFSIFAAGFGVYSGKGRVELMSNPELGISSYSSITYNQNAQTTLFGAQYMNIIAVFYDTANNPPPELWLHGKSTTGLPFTATYRIMKHD